MSLFSRLASAGRALLGTDAGFPGISEYFYGQPWMTPDNLLEYTKAAAKVATVYACVWRISSDLAGLPVKFYQRKGSEYTELPDTHELPILWERGNPEQTGFDTMQDWCANFDTVGESYLFLERGASGEQKPFEIWSVPGHLLAPVPGPHRRVIGYQDARSQEVYPATSVIPLRHWNPNWSPQEPSPRGMSPLSAAQLDYETLYKQSQWIRRFFESGGDVNLWLKPIDKDRRFLPEEKKAIREALEQHASGIKNIGRPKILDGLEVVRPGMSMQEMQFIDVGKAADLSVCRVYQVPPVILGIKDGGGMSDAGATTDLRLYAENCIAPRATKIGRVLTKYLCSIWGPDIVCELDVAVMPGMQSSRLEKAKTLVLLTGRPILTVDEARDDLDYDPAENGEGEGLVVPFALMPASELNAPRPEPVAPPVATPKPVDDPEVERAARLADDPKARLRRWKDSDLGRYERRVGAWTRARFGRQEQYALEALEALRPPEVAAVAPKVDVHLNVEQKAVTRSVTFKRDENGDLEMALVTEKVD